MDAVYNRHVLGPKTTLNLFFPSSGNTPEMVGMSQRLVQFSMLNPFLLLQRNAPQIDTFYVKVLFYSFLFDIMPAKRMPLLCERCCQCCQLWFSVGYNAPEMDVFCGVFNVTPMFGWIKMHPARMPFTTDGLNVSFFFTGKCPQNRCLLWQWFSMCHCKMPPTWTSLMTQVVNVKPCKTIFWLGQSPPILAAFRTDVLNVTLCVVKRNAPETDAFYDKCSQCEALLCCTECFQILEQTFFTVKDILADNIRMRSDCLFC